MIFIGSLIGSIIGFKFGGFFGMIFGALLGSRAEVWVRENLLGEPSRQYRVQQSYFEALFTSIGKLAKVDGVVTKDEIRRCESIMQRMQLTSEHRKQAINYFNQGKQPGFDIRPVIEKLYFASGRSYSIKQMFMEMLLEVAAAENQIKQSEWQLMLQICEYLRFPQNLFITLARMRGFDANGSRSQSSNQRQQWTRPPQQKTNPYQVLGVNQSDSKAVIRKAYKKLMSSHHPDKLIAKGMPPEMIEIAKNKTQKIQAAWEDIKQQRGF
ncbi:MAG: co-chaperone DjlA [Gammaproteobacteria bacterium]|jgi:DnaJ like chaperone protein